MKNVLVIDFDDSFIHNICEFVDKLGFSYRLIHHSMVTKELVESFSICLLGPGPGHCSEYGHVLKILKEREVNCKFLGICLGFQMLGVTLGLGLQQMLVPVHGESLELPKVASLIGLNQLKGQFYNSWYFSEGDLGSLGSTITEHNMVVYLKTKNRVGVQFHPESVGTSEAYEVMKFLLKEIHD